MTTSTQTKTPPTHTNLESLLEKWWPLIRAAAWRWADQTDRADHEDLVQEAALAVWRHLQKEPEAGAAYLRQVAEHAARDSLCRGKSIDRPLVQGKKKGEPRRRNPWVLESLEALQEKEEKAGRGFAVHPRRDGVLPDPTAELALAQLMHDALKERLTPRQRQVLELRLQEYSESEVATLLGISQPQVNRHVIAIRAKALAMWGDSVMPLAREILTPAEERRRQRARQRYARRREAYNARRRARRWGKALPQRQPQPMSVRG